MSASRLVVGLALLFACGGASSSGSDVTGAAPPESTTTSPPAEGSSTSATPTKPPPDAGATPVTIFTIVMENHDYAEIIGSPNAPYINSLASKYGLATHYDDSGVHPSLPNYLVMISGAPQYRGLVDLDPTTTPFPVDKPNLGTQMQAAKVPWRSYQESMTTPCKLTNASPYAPKHDPFLYFTDMQGKTLCEDKNVDYTMFAADLASGLYRYMFITPNLTDDGHDPQKDPVTGLKVSDAWAAKEIPKILESDAYKKGGVLFLTWDEAENRSGPGSADRIPMIIASERIKSAGFTSDKPYTHKSYLATVEDLLGLPRLATVTSEPSMLEFFR